MEFTAKEARKVLESQRTIIEREAIQTDFAPLYQSIVPVTTEGNPFATSIVYSSSEDIGRAEWINGNADDVPLADNRELGAIAPIHTASIGYGYGFEELGANPKLTSAKPRAARRAYEEFVDEVALNGAANKGLTGLFNQNTTYNATRTTDSQNWATLDPKKIMEMLHELIAGVRVGKRIVADTILLPDVLFKRLAYKFYTDTLTGVGVFAQTNPYTAETGRPLNIRSLGELDDKSQGGKARVIAYRNDPDVVKLHIPMPHRFLDTYQAGPLRFEVPGIFRLGGVNVTDQNAFHYLDND